MLDRDLIEGFEWDVGNRGKNAKHGVEDGEAEQLFLSEPLFVLADTRHSRIEPRYHALGRTVGGRLLHVTFTLRHGGTRVGVISARDMHRRERAIYEAKAKENP